MGHPHTGFLATVFIFSFCDLLHEALSFRFRYASFINIFVRARGILTCFRYQTVVLSKSLGTVYRVTEELYIMFNKKNHFTFKINLCSL